jgi:hypothetical protein
VEPEPESLFPISYPLLWDENRIKRLSVGRIKSDKMKFAAPRDDDVFAKILPRSRFSNFETEDSDSEMLQWLQAKQTLTHPINSRTRQAIRTQNATIAQLILVRMSTQVAEEPAPTETE